MKIALLGDIALFDTGLLSKDYKKGLSQIKKILDDCDLVVGNLEVPITSQKHTYVCKGIHLKTDNRIVDVLKYLNVKAVSLANNHICDFGTKGMEDTVNVLRENDINYYGVNGINWLYSDGERVKLSFEGFCCYSTNGAHYINKKKKKGVNTLSVKELKRRLEINKQDNRLPILSLHWGDEYSNLPNEMQVNLFHRLARDYDFIIHGHHAHVMQGIESVNHSLAAYNLGNFCFDECTSPVNRKLVIKQGEENKNSYILVVDVENNQVVNWKTIGIYYDNFEIKLIDNNERIRQLSKRIDFCSTEEYKQESREMVEIQKRNNLQKHDLKWLVSKMNYYSIGAKILSYHNRSAYYSAMEIKK